VNVDEFKRHLRWAEGVKNFPYEDTEGNLTIGVGRNLDSNGLTDDEVEFLLQTDANNAIKDAKSLPYWDSLNSARQLVVCDLCFNLGLTRFLRFTKTNAALSAGEYDKAADEMVDSRWYKQTGRRAERLVDAMRTGLWRF